jgi:hypothetical protein
LGIRIENGFQRDKGCVRINGKLFQHPFNHRRNRGESNTPLQKGLDCNLRWRRSEWQARSTGFQCGEGQP